MGNLLSSAIKMQGASAPATATLQINNLDAALSNCAWEKNGVTQASIPNNTTFDTTLNAGDTFYVYASQIFLGATIEYYLNGTFVTSYSADPIATTPTFTAVGGNAYRFDCYSGF